MDIRLAYTFNKVAELGNITRAAEQLGYSQASVTAHIQQLEQQLGVPLFDRIGRGIRLTDAGRDFREYASRLIQASESADAFAADWEAPRGAISIETSSTPSLGIFPDLLPRFRKRYPGIFLVLQPNDDTEAAVENVRQSRTDFAVLFDRLRDYEDCVTAASRYTPFLFVAPAADPITRKRKVSLEEIFAGDFIDNFSTDAYHVQQREVLLPFLSDHPHLQPALQFASGYGVRKLLLRGYGRAFLPRFMVEEDIKRGTLAPIKAQVPDSGIHLQLIYHKHRWLSPPMRAFLEFIREELGE